MSRSFNRSEILFTQEVSALASGAEIDTGFIDYAEVNKLQLSLSGAEPGLTIVQEAKYQSGSTDVRVITQTLKISTAALNIPARDRFIRFRIQNNTGAAISSVGVQVKASFGVSDGGSVLPLSVDPLDPSQALLTQSVIIGQDPFGTFVNANVNEAGALLVSDFGTEVARGLYENYEVGTKFGRNPEIDINSAPEDIYNGGDEYTGFNATNNENISVTSDDNDDRGALVTSGTATGGSYTTLIDASATFISDGVAVDDLVINDTQGIHGVITSVDSETQLTVWGMLDGTTETLSNNAGDEYRIATSIDSGAAVLKLMNVLSEGFVREESVYIILNGTTTVTTTGVNCIRTDRGRIILAGSSGRNEGEITVTQAVSTSNVFCVIPTFGSTTIGCFTVPAGKDCVVKKIITSIVRQNGSAGAATIALNVRRYGQAFTAERVYEVQTGASLRDESIGGLILPPGTDIKGTVEEVSDNNTVAQIEIEYFFIDRP